MMQLSDNLTNSEKANLLREKREKKKKRHVQKTQPKSEDTSASERHYTQIQNQDSNTHPKSQSVVCIFQSEKRDSSWWACNQVGSSRDKEDTCSRVSCALKNILSQRLGFMSCIAILLSLSGVVAIYWLMASGPKSEVKKNPGLKSGPADGKKCGMDKLLHDRPMWDESKTKLMSGLSDLYDTDFSESSLHSASLQEGSRGNDLSNVLDPNMLSEGYGSNRLRDFYKKLIRTDMQIKNLKKSIREARPANPLEYTGFRAKRSVKNVRRRRLRPNLTAADYKSFKDLHVFFPPAPVLQVPFHRPMKVKRSSNDSEPTGFMIENKKMVVKFKNQPKYKALKRFHQHMNMARTRDNQLYHAVRKGAELDGILTRLIEKNFPESVFDPFALRMYTSTVPTKQRHPDYLFSTDESYSLVHKPAKNKPSFRPPLKSTTPQLEYKMEEEMLPTVAEQEACVSVAPVLEPPSKHQLELMQRVPNIRRLLQVEAEEESDEFVTNDREGVRRRRMGLPESDSQAGSKYNPPAVHNPNWKGPMPLYPDEIHIVKPAIENAHKIEVPNKENAQSNDKDISDTEYVEDYFNSKYDKLVKMAQAYSDYGVLEDKKEMRNEKNSKALENRVKLSVQKGIDFLGKLKNFKSDAAIDPEGIRIEFKPEDQLNCKDKKEKMSAAEFFKLGSHLKLAKNQEPEAPKLKLNYEYIYTTPSTLKYPKNKGVPYKGETPVFSRHKRSLKSINEDGTEPVKLETFQADDKNKPNNKPGSHDDPAEVTDFVTDSNDLITQTASFINEDTIPKKLDTNVTVNNEAIIANGIDVNSTDINMIVGDIFGLIVGWVTQLMGFENEHHEHDNETSMLMDFLIVDQYPENKAIVTVEDNMKNLTERTTRNSMYTNSDSGGDNIRYRSRVLMAMEEKSDNATGNNDVKDIKRSEKELPDKKLANATTENNKNANASVNGNINKETRENKTVKKRSATNSDLMFWNEIYDDEYGIKDPLDALKSKDTLFKDGLSKSENWIGTKLKKIADNIRNPKIGKKPIDLRDEEKKVFKRHALFGDRDTGHKQTFVELTANMKKICREAAEAVQRTKTVDEPSGSPESEASTLMGQLVKLMSDLVDIQVQQKTCVPLPPDLRTFLVWLTSPDLSQNSPPIHSYDESSTEAVSERDTDTDMYPTDVRNECLGTIHDVEDLIHLYDEMSEEDKSKMSGVREYLENQLDFLHKQLSTFDGYLDPTMFQMRIRRRSQPEEKRHRRLHRFLKSFGRKRTRSTASFDTLEPFTDNRRTTKRNDVGYTAGVEKNDSKIKRNLQDVYYRALENATSTINTISK